MYNTQSVLALLTLYLGLAYSFSWDIVLAKDRGLEFYNNGTITYSAIPSPSRYILWMNYDPVHNRMLFSNGHSIYAYSFDIAINKTQTFHRNKPDSYLRNLAYDPITELLFGSIENSIYSYLLKPESNVEVNGNVVINLEKDKTLFKDVAVDRCGRYIYWITDTYKIERARFNGTEREVIIDSNHVIRQSLTVETKIMYWIENREHNDYDFFIQSADLNGNNKRTLYSEKEWHDLVPDILAVSKDFIYWGGSLEMYFWQLPKNPPRDANVKPKQIAVSWEIQDIAVNYKIEEQTQGIQNCEALKSIFGSSSVSTDTSLLCVHGTKVSGKSLCECTQGYTGERCDVSVCQNYCLQGNCSVRAEGQPTCRCNAGYFGDRCETNACYKYCLNNGVCSLNRNSEPVCQCTGDYVGERCDVPVFLIKCVQTVSLLKDILTADETTVALGRGMKSTCASTTA